MIFLFSYFFFFKQTTAYELRISDWSSDVCSSDLGIMASRGYNGGGAGAALGATEATNYQYDPEYVWTYELYGRQELADGRLRLTANVFYADYKDYQLTFDRTPTDLADYDFVVDNADKVKTYGAERSEEHTSELQSLMRNSYAVFCLQTKKTHKTTTKRE